MRKYLEKEPDDTEVVFRFAWCFTPLFHITQVMFSSGRCWKRSPGKIRMPFIVRFKDTDVRLKSIYARVGKIILAIETFERLLSMRTNELQILLQLAKLHLRLAEVSDDVELSSEQLEKAIRYLQRYQATALL